MNALDYLAYVDRIKETGSCYWVPINIDNAAGYAKFKKTWYEAYIECRSVYSELVVFDDENERRVVMDILMQSNYMFVRYTQFLHVGIKWHYEAWIAVEDGYAVPVGEVGYVLWGPGQPDNARGDEECTAINKLQDGELHDVQCWDKLNFICERRVDSELLRYS